MLEVPPIEPHATTGWTVIDLNALPLGNDELRILTDGTLHWHTSEELIFRWIDPV